MTRVIFVAKSMNLRLVQWIVVVVPIVHVSNAEKVDISNVIAHQSRMLSFPIRTLSHPVLHLTLGEEEVDDDRLWTKNINVRRQCHVKIAATVTITSLLHIITSAHRRLTIVTVRHHKAVTTATTRAIEAKTVNTGVQNDTEAVMTVTMRDILTPSMMNTVPIATQKLEANTGKVRDVHTTRMEEAETIAEVILLHGANKAPTVESDDRRTFCYFYSVIS